MDAVTMSKNKNESEDTTQISATQTETNPASEDNQDPQEESFIDQPQDVEITSISVLEAVLFATDEPITPAKLAEIVGVGSAKEIRESIEHLNSKYEQMDCAWRIESIAGGCQLLTLGQYNNWLRKLVKVRSENKLTPAALETLSIVAYKQPVMRVDIEGIRGVAAGDILRQLIDKGLVKIAGRAEELGRPLLYGTTRKFLEVFGLGNLNDLPSVDDLKKPE